MTEFTKHQMSVFLDRYALKQEGRLPPGTALREYIDTALSIWEPGDMVPDPYGVFVETLPKEMWSRVADAISSSPGERKDFFDLLYDFKFVPGGRILSGAGTDSEVTYYNCFVIPIETRARREWRDQPEGRTPAGPRDHGCDSREAIVDTMGVMVDILSRGGGVGINWSVLRPKNTFLTRINGRSSGPVTWMDTASHMVGGVEQGGTRRGAAMFMLDDWHPDLLEFIEAKRNLDKITHANVSVAISDRFMQAVKDDADWWFEFPDTTDSEYDRLWDGDLQAWKEAGRTTIPSHSLPARDIWRRIAESAWDNGEPGIVFLERCENESTARGVERILSVNPCLTGDTWVTTVGGARMVRDLVGVPFFAVVDGQPFPTESSGFFSTGTKPVVRLSLSTGHEVRLTSDHRVMTDAGWVAAGDLTVASRVRLHEHASDVKWGGAGTEGEGYLLGLLLGDGILTANEAILRAWQQDDGNGPVMEAAYAATAGMSHRADYAGWSGPYGNGWYALNLRAVFDLARRFGLVDGHKCITDEMESASSDFYVGLLRGLFDTDGHVEGDQKKGVVSVRLSQSDRPLLVRAQRMLGRLGIVSSIYIGRSGGVRALPDGHGGLKDYYCKPGYRLAVGGASAKRYMQRIGFMNERKNTTYEQRSAAKGSYRSRRFARVVSVEPDGFEEVFDVTVQDVHAFDAQGIYVSNCGEQPLGAYSVCNLGAMNLAAYVEGDHFDWSQFADDVVTAVCFLDDVIDKTFYFIPENERIQKDLRRIGLGVMGLADALAYLGLRYGSQGAQDFTSEVFSTMKHIALSASADLAQEKGPAPAWRSAMLGRPYFADLTEEEVFYIRERGLRNVFVLTQAPTGTTSLLAGVNSGIEPFFSLEYERRDATGNHTVRVAPYADWLETAEENEVPPEYLTTADQVTVEEHIAMQAAVQRNVDSSVSKTINAPNSHTVEDVEKAYMLAYDAGLKGVAYFRDGCGRTQILNKVPPPGPIVEDVPVMFGTFVDSVDSEPFVRQTVMAGTTRKVQTAAGSAYITVNVDDYGRPREVFLNVGKAGSDITFMGEALGRLISLAIQNGSHVVDVAEQLTGIGGFSKFSKSLPHAVGEALSEYRSAARTDWSSESTITVQSDPEVRDAWSPSYVFTPHGKEQVSFTVTGTMCPECRTYSVAHTDGCEKCLQCDWSRC